MIKISRYFFLLLVLASMPQIAFSQASGGQITRPTDGKISSSQHELRKPGKSGQSPKIISHSSSNKTSRPEMYNPNLTDEDKVIIVNKIRDNMVNIDGGSYEYHESYENTPVYYNVSSFSMNKYEVTQEEWLAVMGSNPSKYKGNKRPVESVTYNDCILFIQKLNLLTGLNYRLPTNEEWIFAARGGLKTKNYKYIGSNDFKSTTWYAENSGEKTKAVGTKKPNELGLYDMSGNVREYCQEIIVTIIGSPEERICYRGGCFVDYSQFDWRFNSNSWGHTYDERKKCSRDWLGLRLAL